MNREDRGTLISERNQSQVHREGLGTFCTDELRNLAEAASTHRRKAEGQGAARGVRQLKSPTVSGMAWKVRSAEHACGVGMRSCRVHLPLASLGT